jgi:NADPH:quinone reductase-like Zn-dependent oxidoreductase
MEEGKFTPLIDREYSLKEISKAYRYVETGQKTGNVTVNLLLK